MAGHNRKRKHHHSKKPNKNLAQNNALTKSAATTEQRKNISNTPSFFNHAYTAAKNVAKWASITTLPALATAHNITQTYYLQSKNNLSHYLMNLILIGETWQSRTNLTEYFQAFNQTIYAQLCGNILSNTDKLKYEVFLKNIQSESIYNLNFLKANNETSDIDLENCIKNFMSQFESELNPVIEQFWQDYQSEVMTKLYISIGFVSLILLAGAGISLYALSKKNSEKTTSGPAAMESSDQELNNYQKVLTEDGDKENKSVNSIEMDEVEIDEKTNLINPNP